MRLLIDNTLIHRVGRVLDSRGSIPNIDALALFYLAEHILFCEELAVSTVEPDNTLNRTLGVVGRLTDRGIFAEYSGDAAFRLETFSDEEYVRACEAAGWGVLDEVLGMTGKELASLGRLAGEAVRPEHIPPPSIDSWIRNPRFLRNSDERIAKLTAMRSTGSYELTLLLCRQLFDALVALHRQLGRIEDGPASAIGALIRVHVNQQLAGLRPGLVYAPAPQRARIAHGIDRLFRHKIERAIQDQAEREGDHFRGLLSHLAGPDLLPLPLFAFHAFRNSSLGSAAAFLEEARRLRDDPDVKDVRKWLNKWEGRQASSESKDRLMALGELNRFAEAISAYMKGDEPGIMASLHLGGTFKAKPLTGEMAWTLGPSLEELLELVTRRFRRDRRLVAALAGEVWSTDRLGARILRQLQRSVTV